jgi:hypothetical protein
MSDGSDKFQHLIMNNDVLRFTEDFLPIEGVQIHNKPSKLNYISFKAFQNL